MRCLLPIAPASAGELPLFASAEALAAVVLPVARSVLAIPGARLVACTPLPQVAELLRPLANETLLAPLPGGAGTLSQGEHARQALAACLERGVLAPDEPVLLADFRNLRLGADTLRRAWEALAGGGLWASFAPLRDHPLQYRAPCRMLGLDLLVLPDAADPGRTRPFFFDWRALGLWDAGPEARLLRLDAADSAGALPLWPGGDVPPDAALFAPASPVSARRLLPAGAVPDRHIEAVPAYAPDAALPLRLRPRADGGLDWAVGPGCAAAGLLLLWPLETVDGPPGQRLELAFGALSDGDAARSGSLPQVPGADAWLACLLAHAGPGPYDLFLPLGGGGLWRVDAATGRAVHARTGRFFNNRQEFPALHEPDLALCGGPAAVLAAALAQPGPGDWGVLELAPGEALKVRDRLGLALETGLRLPASPEPDASEPGGPEAPCPGDDAPAYLDLPEYRPAEAGDAASLARARAALARLNWRQRQLQWLAERHPRAVQADHVLGWALFARANELAVTVQRRLCQDEIAALVRAGALAAERSPLARPVPGPLPPGHPLGLVEGPRGVACLCLRGEDGRGRLFAKALHGGEPAPFGRPGVDYLSLCRAGGLVHALFLRQDGAARAGLDSFDVSGPAPRLAATRPLPRALQHRPRLVKMSGDGAALFLLDFECRFVFELSLPDALGAELVLRDVHGMFGSDIVQAFAARGGGLYAVSFYDSALAVKELAGGGVARTQNAATLMAALVERDVAAGRTLLVSRADFPADYAPTPHWLHWLDDTGAPRLSLALGPVLAAALTVLEDTGEALVFCRDGLLLRCPGGRG